jgi:hypothetical protein
VWQNEPAVDAKRRDTADFAEECYLHADGTVVIVREYHADGSFLVMSDRGEIELVDNANDPYAPDPISLVRLP